MQNDQPTKFATPDGRTIMHQKNGPEGLPPHLIEAMKAADVLILIGSSEGEAANTISIQHVYAGGEMLPHDVASHAYAQAIRDAHPELMKHINGAPTDAQRFHALRDFAVLANTDKERFDGVNNMLFQFETESGIPPEGKRTAEDFERMADFLVHAMLETAPLVVEQKRVVN